VTDTVDGYQIPRQRGTEGVPRVGLGPLMAMSHWTLHEYDEAGKRWRPTGLVFLDKRDAEYVGQSMARTSRNGILVMPFFPGFDRLRRRWWRRRWVVVHRGSDAVWRDTGLSYYRRYNAAQVASRLRVGADSAVIWLGGTYLAVRRREADRLTSAARDLPAEAAGAQEQPPA